MKSIKFSSSLDVLFLHLLTFIFCLMWVKFFCKNILFALILSGLITIMLNLTLVFFKNKKKLKNKINNKLKIDIENYAITLLSNTSEENLIFFSNIYKENLIKINKKNNVILINKNNKKIAICPMFQLENLNFELSLKQINVAKKENFYKIVLLCNSIDEKTKLRLYNLNDIVLSIYNKFEIYENIFKVYGKYPPINYTAKSKTKLNLKLLYYLSFQKSNAKKFFFSGFFLFFCSFFIRNNIYYLVFSSFLFFLSFMCLFNPSKKLE